MSDLQLSVKRQTDTAQNQREWETLVDILHRGGTWAYTWARYEGSNVGGDSFWWNCESEPPPKVSGTPKNLHLYFSVHPLAVIPTTNKSGEPTQPHRVRGRIEHVAAINCVFADLDLKDFENGKAFLNHISALEPKPSCLVFTGYGAHLYWFLSETYAIYSNSAAIERAAQLQYRWQEYTKSDPGAKDLARVLRVPGTENWKNGKMKPCRIKRLEPDLTYTLEQLESYLPAAHPIPTAATPPPAIKDLSAEIARAKMALELLKPWRADDREQWIEIGMALKQLGEDGLRLWDEWSQQSKKYDEADCAAKWTSFDDPAAVLARQPITLGTLYHHAREDAKDFTEADEKVLLGLLDSATDTQSTIAQRRKAKAALASRLIWYPADVQDEIRAEAKAKKWNKAEFDKVLEQAVNESTSNSDDEGVEAVVLGQTWLKFYPDSLRANDEWYRYGDGVWQPRHDELIYRELHEVATDIGIEPKISILDGAVKIARAYAPRRDPTQWNPDSQLLVVENGVLDISTVPPKFFEWSNQVYNRVRMPVVWDPEADCPTYKHALASNFNGDRDVIKFFVQFAGLALAEDARWEISPWMSGPAGGGKSTILAGVSTVLGEYAAPVDLERLDRYAHGAVALVDKKLVFATEVDTKFLHNPGVLNAVISHEPILINPKNRPEYSYIPRCSLIFAVNELPGTANPESGLFRRVKIIEVAARSAAARDPEIIRTIKQSSLERSGMLNLFLEGLAETRKRGAIAMPASVEIATREWHIENDKVRLHIMERCDVDPKKTVGSTELYNDFKAWCRSSGVRPYGITQWGKRMTALRYKKYKSGGNIVYIGLELKTQISSGSLGLSLARS